MVNSAMGAVTLKVLVGVSGLHWIGLFVIGSWQNDGEPLRDFG